MKRRPLTMPAGGVSGRLLYWMIIFPVCHGRNQARDNGAEPEALPRAEQAAPKASPVDTDAAAALAKLLADPSMATLIKNLAKNL